MKWSPRRFVRGSVFFKDGGGHRRALI
jgi:hypothetical protein